MKESNLSSDKHELPPPTRPPMGSIWAWLNIALTILLLAAGILYLVGRVSLAALWQALVAANLFYILLSLLTILSILLLKTWRWQLMFPPRQQAPPFMPLFWALLLGAYVNILVPFFRLGELARIFALDRLTIMSKTRTLGTLVLEKTLDMMMLGLLLAVVVSAVVIPDFLNETNSTLILGGAALIVLLVLALIALKTEWIIRLMQAVFKYLPPSLAGRLTHWTITGLEGLAALRDRRLALILLGSSAVIALISLLTPLLLFAAFHIPFGWVEAAVINIAITLALVPPTTPGKIGIFDGVAAFLLLRFGLENEATIAGFTIIFHLVAVLPLIILGSIAASRTGWQWRRSESR
ncbi:MAG: flippase-like domain-containing protein [Chloroflexi bacterium]|nr:flippase-like domain-containing protein [Chloroflexota bacterium]